MAVRPDPRACVRALRCAAAIEGMLMAGDEPYPRGCQTQDQVNIGYYPMRVTRDANLRFGASREHPARQRLLTGQRVGRQSEPNPSGHARPGPRPRRGGFVWVYVLKGGRSGWVDASVIAPDAGGWADGPESVDFEVGGAPGVRHAPRRKRRRRVRIGWRASGRRHVNAEQAYLRYAAHSTPFEYLMRGDVVERRWRHPRGYVCVVVISSRTAREGAIGWVVGSALARRSG
jgi:hypothetical protein